MPRRLPDIQEKEGGDEGPVPIRSPSVEYAVTSTSTEGFRLTVGLRNGLR